MRRRRVAVVIVVGLVSTAVVAGAVLWTPSAPLPDSQAAVATELETVMPALDELGVNLWRDGYVGGCRHVSLTPGGRFQTPATGCGDAAPFESRAQSAWDRIAALVADIVPGGRIQSVLVVSGTVTFIAVPRTLLGQDALLMRWVWRWDPGTTADQGLPSHWHFTAANAAVV
jgi:hypothetical protein